jgi:YggT family protein
MLTALAQTLYVALEFFSFLLFGYVILSWLITFGVINTQNQFVSTIWRFLQQIIEPLLAPIRRIVPPMGGLDLAFLVLIFGIIFLRFFLAGSVIPFLASSGL